MPDDDRRYIFEELDEIFADRLLPTPPPHCDWAPTQEEHAAIKLAALREQIDDFLEDPEYKEIIDEWLAQNELKYEDLPPSVEEARNAHQWAYEIRRYGEPCSFYSGDIRAHIDKYGHWNPVLLDQIESALADKTPYQIGALLSPSGTEPTDSTFSPDSAKLTCSRGDRHQSKLNKLNCTGFGGSKNRPSRLT